MDRKKVGYEVVETEFIDYGANKFIEVSIKKVIPGDDEFISISKGHYSHKKDRRYQGAVGFPINKELVNQITKTLTKYNNNGGKKENGHD